MNKLPSKYHSLYSYAKKVCTILKAKTTKSKLENEEGKFVLYHNLQFEAVYKNGYKV